MTPTYKSWAGMLQRCNNPNNSNYKDYGGRGITVCEDWRIYANFRKDMGRKPEGQTLDRIDNNKGYDKDNCRWATSSQQNNNRRERIRGYSRIDNTSGLAGVSFDTRRSMWDAYAFNKGTKIHLYFGDDYFLACCARKSFEYQQNLSRNSQPSKDLPDGD